MQTTYDFREEAIPFVVYDQDQRKFTLTEEAVQFVSAIQGPIGIVAVAGMYRTGKSYLLNRMLLNRSNGFGVGPTINPCTKGLWVWGKPVPGTTPDGEPLNVLIVDTEGLGALDEDSNHDVRIFSLAILLSSFFIYNSVGSIDESALQNLSLVINLTKNIQIKSKVSGGSGMAGDETDIEEYGLYFPTFMWVVRDFTLQLVDQEGEPLTSKEYLEKALEIQKGFSDSVEQKNRIRRLLKSFFKERDCCTMIRPLTNEENLQNLTNMDLEELRPDFVEQVMQLRRKVVSRVRAKTLNGKKLTGSMLAKLAEAYVDAINNGAVPNIDTAWSYICKSECQKAVDEAYSNAENMLREQVSQKLPLNEEELDNLFKEAKVEALTLYQKKAVGSGVTEEYVNELKKKLKVLCEQIREENENISTQACFAEYYDHDLRQFQDYFIENGPLGPRRILILLDFVQRALAEAADFFGRSIQNELDLQRSILGEQHKHLEAQIKEIKQDSMKERDHFESRLRQGEFERAELSAIETTLRETVDRLNQDKASLEEEMRDQIQVQKGSMAREIDECRSKMSSQESQIAELQRQIIQGESEIDKDRALLEQKIEFLERTITDLQKKENDYSIELKSQKKEHTSHIREVQQKNEEQNKDLTTKLDVLQEKYLEATNQLESLEQRYAFDKQQWEESSAQLKNAVGQSQTQSGDFKKALDEAKNKNKAEFEKLQFELDEAREQLRFSEEELEGTLKDKDEEIKSLKNALDKETAIFKQKIEFKDVQNQQLKASLEEARSSHEQMIRAIENKVRDQVDGREIAQQQVSELKESHLLELQELELQYSQTKQALESALDSMTEKHSELELRYKMLQDEYSQEMDTLHTQVDNLEKAKQRALDQNKSQDTQKLRMLEESETRHTSIIAQLEKELEDREQKAIDELREIQHKSEEALSQLKNFYEIEKERVENRLTEERERSTKKLSMQHEEFESRLRDEQTQHEEDVEMLQEELRENDRRYQAYQGQAEHENALLMQKVETLESYLREKEDRLSKEQSLIASQLDAQIERFNNERKELTGKIDQLNNTLTGRDRELTVTKNKLEAVSEDLDKRRKQLDEARSEFNSERQKLNEKIDSLRSKNQELSDEHMQRRLDDGRELALYKQKQEFQQKKIDELQKTCDEQYSKYEERMQTQKIEYQQELQEAATKFAQQREQAEIKYDLKRKQFKDIEQGLIKQMADLNRERAVLDEKLANSESKIDEIRNKTEYEIINFKDQINAINEQLSKEREAFMTESDRLRQNTQEQERELSEISASYERDRALWEGKFNFLEQQRDQAKADFQEAASKFNMTLEQLQKRGSAEKDKIEHSQHTLLGSIESKFKQQLRETQEQFTKEKADLQERLKNFEKENRSLNNRIQYDAREKSNEQGSLQKKVQDLMENEGRLQRELDDLKTERDRRVTEGQRILEKEKEVLKARMQEIETKSKDLEIKRSDMLFDFEKERTKWAIEKDHISSQKQEVQEHVDRLQRKVEDLLKENEKLKSDRNIRKQQQYLGNANGGAAGFQPSGYGGVQASGLGKYNGAAFGQHFSQKQGGPSTLSAAGTKENPTAIGQSQIFTSGLSKFIGDGNSHHDNKPDPHQLPFSTRENHSTLPSSTSFATNIRARMGSPSQQQQTVLTSQMLQGQMLQYGKPLSSNGSVISGNGGQIMGPGSDDSSNN